MTRRFCFAMLGVSLALLALPAAPPLQAQDGDTSTVAFDRLSLGLPGTWTGKTSADGTLHGATSPDYPGIELVLFRAADGGDRTIEQYEAAVLQALEKDHQPLRGHRTPQTTFAACGMRGLLRYRQTKAPDGRERHLYLIVFAVGARYQCIAFASFSADANATVAKELLPAANAVQPVLPAFEATSAAEVSGASAQVVDLFNCRLRIPASWKLEERSRLQPINWLTALVQLPYGGGHTEVKVAIRLSGFCDGSPLPNLSGQIHAAGLPIEYPASAAGVRTQLREGSLAGDSRVQVEWQARNPETGSWYSRLAGACRVHGRHQLSIVTGLGDNYFRVMRSADESRAVSTAFTALCSTIAAVLDSAQWFETADRPDRTEWLTKQKTFRYFREHSVSGGETWAVFTTKRQWDFAADGTVTVLDDHFSGASIGDSLSPGTVAGTATITGKRKGTAHFEVVECRGELWIVLAFEDLTTSAHRLVIDATGWSIDGYVNGTNERR